MNNTHIDVVRATTPTLQHSPIHYQLKIARVELHAYDGEQCRAAANHASVHHSHTPAHPAALRVPVSRSCCAQGEQTCADSTELIHAHRHTAIRDAHSGEYYATRKECHTLSAGWHEAIHYFWARSDIHTQREECKLSSIEWHTHSGEWHAQCGEQHAHQTKEPQITQHRHPPSNAPVAVVGFLTIHSGRLFSERRGCACGALSPRCTAKCTPKYSDTKNDAPTVNIAPNITLRCMGHFRNLGPTHK